VKVIFPPLYTQTKKFSSDFQVVSLQKHSFASLTDVAHDSNFQKYVMKAENFLKFFLTLLLKKRLEKRQDL
jgi:hypothetical protein